MILGGIEVNSLNIRSVIGDDPLLTLFWVNGWGNLNPNTPTPTPYPLSNPGILQHSVTFY